MKKWRGTYLQKRIIKKLILKLWDFEEICINCYVKFIYTISCRKQEKRGHKSKEQPTEIVLTEC